MSETILQGYLPGAIGRMIELHATYYYLNWGFGLFFETKVATEMSEFLARFDERRDGFWTLCFNNRVEGGIAIDGIKGQSFLGHGVGFVTRQTQVGNDFEGQILVELELHSARNGNRLSSCASSAAYAIAASICSGFSDG